MHCTDLRHYRAIACELGRFDCKSNKMKYAIYVFLFFIVGCSKTQANLELVAVQHIGKGILHGDACKTLYREGGHDVVTPENFKITPFEAVEIAKQKLGYSCGSKFGSQVLADGESYYIVRLGVAQDAIIINGMYGTVESKGFLKSDK